MMSGILPRWFVAHPFDPPFQIWTTRKGKWSEDIGRVLEYQAPTLSPDHRYPLERRCDAIVGAELAEGRTVMAYYEQSTERDVGARLMQILGRHNPWKLPDTVDAEDREDAIVAAVKRGHKLVIVGYRQVAAGRRTITVRSRKLKQGRYRIDVRARDASGNISTLVAKSLRLRK